MPHPQYTGRPRKVILPLNEKQKEYIELNYQTLSVHSMAVNRHLPTKLIYEYLNEKGYKSFDGRRKEREPVSTEFFRWADFDNCAI